MDIQLVKFFSINSNILIMLRKGNSKKLDQSN